MKITTFENPTEFIQILKNSSNSYENNSFMFGLIQSLIDNPDQYKCKPLLATIEDENEIKLTVFMTPSWPIVLYSEQLIDEDAMLFLIDFLLKNDIDVSGVNARKDVAESFAFNWKKSKKCLLKLKIEMIFYVLKNVCPVNSSSGFLRKAIPSDKTLLIEWAKKFNKEIQLGMDDEYLEYHVEYEINRNNVYVWVDNDEIVSMTFLEGPFDKGSFIGYVFTPFHLRNKGYATNCVAHVCRDCLNDKFDFSCLFASKNNPMTNRIYQKIGFCPICNYKFYGFDSQL